MRVRVVARPEHERGQKGSSELPVLVHLRRLQVEVKTDQSKEIKRPAETDASIGPAPIQEYESFHLSL
jgi:hypothetical protein